MRFDIFQGKIFIHQSQRLNLGFIPYTSGQSAASLPREAVWGGYTVTLQCYLPTDSRSGIREGLCDSQSGIGRVCDSQADSLECQLLHWATVGT